VFENDLNVNVNLVFSSDVFENELNVELEKLKWPFQKKWLSEPDEVRHYFVMFSPPGFMKLKS
jgi:hypothetical protein